MDNIIVDCFFDSQCSLHNVRHVKDVGCLIVVNVWLRK